MSFTIDTESAVYQTHLTRLRATYALVRNNYGPVTARMNKQQLVYLYNHDELFKELIDMAKDLNNLAERVGGEI